MCGWKLDFQPHINVWKVFHVMMYDKVIYIRHGQRYTFTYSWTWVLRYAVKHFHILNNFSVFVVFTWYWPCKNCSTWLFLLTQNDGKIFFCSPTHQNRQIAAVSAASYHQLHIWRPQIPKEEVCPTCLQAVDTTMCLPAESSLHHQ